MFLSAQPSSNRDSGLTSQHKNTVENGLTKDRYKACFTEKGHGFQLYFIENLFTLADKIYANHYTIMTS